jgi:chemotaxis response regulator CheB
MWHRDCMIHRLAAALAVEQAKRTPEPPSTPGESTRQVACTLTDEEREAVAYYVGTGGPDAVDATLRGLLERLK